MKLPDIAYAHARRVPVSKPLGTVFYMSRGWTKYAEIDDYEQGCLMPTDADVRAGGESFTGNTPAEVIEKFCELIGFTDWRDIEPDACDEPGRVDISRTENNDGERASEDEITSWKKGEYSLWYVTYTLYILRCEPVEVTRDWTAHRAAKRLRGES